MIPLVLIPGLGSDAAVGRPITEKDIARATNHLVEGELTRADPNSLEGVERVREAA